MKVIITIILIFALMIAGPALASNHLGEAVDDFTLLDLQGNPISLSDFSGKLVLINFFATWCPPCNDEAPMLEEMWQDVGGQEFVVLGINLLENPNHVIPWVEYHGLTYPILHAPNWSLFQSFPQAGGIPYNAVVDQFGILRYSQYGLNMAEIEDLVESLLPTDPVTPDVKTFDAVKAIYR